MLMSQVSLELQNKVADVAEALGYQLWGIELSSPSGRGQLLRIYIDKPDGVNLDDCALVSAQVSALLDVEDPIAGRYVLEVSSPGMDRPIFTLAQFAALCGSRIRVKLRTTVTGRKNYRGELHAVEGKCLKLIVDGQQVELFFPDVESAHVAPEF
jgi:ribosome maturation factor RimP